ncbi:hypothetical protein MML48_3g00017106 [Holotrichia oblita]|uniref:Uncharacterized protein n=1 Tax=Holotrichia oblita TaxID=644536 RepID=A0ACB9TFK2_HOLOL|nr:hypothetical protein MML48_3g00017106 [Holotrichia oblita]
MTPRSIPIGQMKQQLSSVQSTNTSTEIVTDSITGASNSRCETKTEVPDENVKEKPMIGLPIAFDTSRLVQLTENTFPLSSDQPLNIKIMLHAAARQQMTSTRTRKGQPRGYPPMTNPMLFDDDPGIMSEVETSSTGFRRGGKQRSSLPVVRTPSKTLERPLGLVFLQYRNETKRALLPNEITSIDTVKALFVRSFPKQLTMEYLDSPQVKIYIHDSSKDMFYELEDLRSHLREIRDRSVLRLFESADVSGGLPMPGIGIIGGMGHAEDPSYFSEPEFDSEYQHQHIHKSKSAYQS